MLEDSRDKPIESGAEFRLRQFAILCNQHATHPRDWRRFYLFCVYAHQRRVGWDKYNLQARLKGFGFTPEEADDLSTTYWHIRCALHMTKPRSLQENYNGWMKSGGIAFT
ncbi:MAG: hypothetical protein P4L40_20845 [Terracidiphilus sp.]|nr:hypothetical protein [Terracidiphilus sp.]